MIKGTISKSTPFKIAIAILAVASNITSWTAPANAGDGGLAIKAGKLNCEVEGSVGYVLGSSKLIHCTYTNSRGRKEHYEGKFRTAGVDVGFTSGEVIVWTVLAATKNVPSGALHGTFIGIQGGAALGLGLGAHALVLGGGYGKHPKLALQPLSFRGIKGLNVAGGFASLELTPR